MRDTDCVAFLQWALPRLGLRWPGFRRVRGQVCKRIARRMRELGMADVGTYRAHLEASAEEWPIVDAACRITISRFSRDRALFDALRASVLPALAEGALGREARVLRVWSAGCASGEEAYSVALAWEMDVRSSFPALSMEVLGTDANERLLDRARRACYAGGTLRELPVPWRAAFAEREGKWCLFPERRAGARFEVGDLRRTMPCGPFDLVLCRNLAFTYFAEPLQQQVLAGIATRLVRGGGLVVGAHERVPETGVFAPWPGARCVYERR